MATDTAAAAAPAAGRPALPAGPTIDAGLALVRRRPRATLLPLLVLFAIDIAAGVVIALLAELLIGSHGTSLETVRQSTVWGDSNLVVREVPEYSDGQWTIFGVTLGLRVLLSLWLGWAAVVALVRAVQADLADEEPLAVRDAVRGGLRGAPRAFGTALLATILGLVALAVLVGVVAASAAAAAPLALLLGLGVVALVVAAAVRLVLWLPVQQAEGLGVGLRPFRRSWELTRGQFWPLLGMLLLLWVIVAVIAGALLIVVGLVSAGTFALDQNANLGPTILTEVVSAAGGLLVTALAIAPVVVAHRALAGPDARGLFAAAERMGRRPEDPGPFGSGPPRAAPAAPPLAGPGDAGDPAAERAGEDPDGRWRRPDAP
ncbi:hypothetical protein SK069_11610 [Patulibacter brassicae]|jgi:hypothetical protein|uniref:Glycerophosphoryl diester phosphodiesterase membrane domain-containing protein n=1 Tax=Patulibacter brassicae TaxID=1705717 RepID=A0ABU4VK88_9ACTN|nr:hypothetical protein [Patulibacter brassicae]MDX8152245.1 hypothetical protein [Patulibacter brassicae]